MKIIAEVANVHEGDEQYLLSLVNKLIENKLVDIKLQYIIPSELGIVGSDNYKEFKRLELSIDFIKTKLMVLMQNCNIYYDIFGEQSFKEVKLLHREFSNIVGIKIHTTNAMDYSLIKQSVDIFEMVFISLSGLSAVEISKLIGFLVNNQLTNKVVLSYGVQNYPTEIKDIKLNKLTELKKISGMRIALSDHLDGDLPLSKDIVNYAWILGYDFCEKHVTLDRSRKLDDDHAALEVEELSSVVSNLELLSPILAKNILSLTPKEVEYRDKVKKVFYAKTDLCKGKLITENDIYLSRQEGDIKTNSLSSTDIFSKKVRKEVRVGGVIERKHIEPNIYGIILVRSSSSRFPEKCYKKVGNMESIRFLIRRIKKSRQINKLFLCTTLHDSDNQLEKIAEEEDVECFRGEENVASRIDGLFARFSIPDYFVRLTGDNLFVDHNHLDDAIGKIIDNDCEYYKHEKVIDGCDFEIIRNDFYSSLSLYFNNYNQMSEYMTLFLNNSYVNKLEPIEYIGTQKYHQYRLTLDHKEDYENISRVQEHIGNSYFTYDELYKVVTECGVYKIFKPKDKALDVVANKLVSF